MQACGEITCHFQCRVVEPQRTPDRGVSRRWSNRASFSVCWGSERIFEIDTTTWSDCLILLMAAYYVFDIEYPSVWKPSLLFQEILMDKKVKKETRPIRYTTYLMVFDIISVYNNYYSYYTCYKIMSFCFIATCYNYVILWFGIMGE